MHVNEVNDVSEGCVLVDADRVKGKYRIAVNNSTTYSELIADFSYLNSNDSGQLSFDLTHMAIALSETQDGQQTPRGFGYQPANQLVEVASAITAFANSSASSRFTVNAILPEARTKVGKFVHDMRLPAVLNNLNVSLSYQDPSVIEQGRDDSNRRNLIPLTVIKVEPVKELTRCTQEIRGRVEAVFAEALPEGSPLVNRFTSIVSEAVDNQIEYGNGGLIGGLYYPHSGEVEITLFNRDSGFGGVTSDEQLEKLLDAIDSGTSRPNGGGNGINNLCALTDACFGTLLLRNGSATLMLSPDGSVVSSTEATDIYTAGASVTVLLQLLPGNNVERTEIMQEFEFTIEASLDNFNIVRNKL